MLSPEVDLLPRILLPLAGPEEFDDEDNEKLPLDLQYLPDDKTREPEPEIRKMLLEIIMQVRLVKKSRDTYCLINVLKRFIVFAVECCKTNSGNFEKFQRVCDTSRTS